MAAIHALNPKAELARAQAALEMNVSGARGLQDVMKSNLGPRGTLKMLVSGAGDIKLTKDGNVLMHEMQIQHPTATLIARASTAQDDVTGDGTTSIALLIGELLKLGEAHVADGLHPRLIVEGYNVALKRCLELLDELKLPLADMNKKLLSEVVGTALRTKVHRKLADHLTECVVDAVLQIQTDAAKAPDLFMVEVMSMEHRTDLETAFVRGLVLDHGARHPDMPKRVENAFILTLNVSLEYEKTEVNAGFFYKTSDMREQFLKAEREHIEQRTQRIIDLKRQVCAGKDNCGFVVINQKGIDPPCLDMFAKEGIVALRRAKRRNMERLELACGGEAVQAIGDAPLDAACLGYAGLVYEHVLGEEKYTFVENCKDPKSVTLLIKGPNKHTIEQIKDAIRDGLRAARNAIDDRSLVAGAGAFEVAAYCELMRQTDSVSGKARLGVQAFANALMVIPKSLAANAGLDQQDVAVRLQDERGRLRQMVGVDLSTGEPFLPAEQGIWDNVSVKRSVLEASHSLACNILLVDEVMRAGMTSLSG